MCSPFNWSCFVLIPWQDQFKQVQSLNFTGSENQTQHRVKSEASTRHEVKNIWTKHEDVKSGKHNNPTGSASLQEYLSEIDEQYFGTNIIDQNFSKLTNGKTINPTRLDFGWLMGVVYFDQLLGAARTKKLVETFFFCRFSTFFVHF